MQTKIIATCMTLAAFAAFSAMPAASSAAPVITHPTGTVLATGTKLVADNVGVAKFTSSVVNVECSNWVMTGPLKTNNATNGFKGEITNVEVSGTGKDADCTGAGSFFNGSVNVTPETGVNGLPWCVQSTNVGDNFEVVGGACGGVARNIRVALDLTGSVTCVYERTGGIPGTFTTHPQTVRGTISEVVFSRVSGFACPATGKLDLTFALETDVAGSPELYIS